LGRVTSEDAASYTCDILGNPANATEDNLIYTLDNEDRVTQVNDVSSILAQYTYDRLGKRMSKTAGSETTYFAYDKFGNVIAEYVQDGNDVVWQKDYVYGALGELVYMQLPKTTTSNQDAEDLIDFLDAWLCNPDCTQDNLYWDFDDNNQINFVDWAGYCDDFAEAFRDNGRYVLTDFRGSVVGMTDSNGVFIEISYNAWGTPSYTGDLEGLNVLWNGYYYDAETENYYLRNRYYSPLERRFITEDPRGINPDGNWDNPFDAILQYSDGFGLQVYCQGDSINNKDPYGLESCGLFVRCGKLEETDWLSKWLNSVGFRHCDIGKGKSERGDEIDYEITMDKSSGRTLQNGSGSGKSCKCAKCDEIANCANKEYLDGMKSYSAYGNNCHTFTAKGLSKCCMKSKWRPAFHAGPDPTCTSWELRVVRIEPWGPIYETVCVARSPAY